MKATARLCWTLLLCGVSAAHAATPTPAPTPEGAKALPEALAAELKERVRFEVTVTRPDGKPAKGATVSLMSAVGGAPAGRLRAVADGAGRAVFEAVPHGPRARHLATSAHAGVSYQAEFAVPSGAKSAAAVIALAETTDKADGLKLSRLHLIVDPKPDGISMTELLVVSNTGKSTYAGPPLRLPLFAGASALAGQAASAGAVRQSGADLELTGHLRPGETQLHFEYRLPMQGHFERTSPMAVGELFVALTNPRFKLQGPSIRAPQEIEERGTRFVLSRSGAVEKGGRIVFHLEAPNGAAAPGQGKAAAANTSMQGSDERPRPGPPRDKNAKGELVKDWRVVSRWLTPLFALFVFFGVVYAAGRRDDRAARDVPALEADRRELLQALAKVTPRARAGEKGALRRETELLNRLADVYRALDELQAQQVLASTRSDAARPVSKGA